MKLIDSVFRYFCMACAAIAGCLLPGILGGICIGMGRALGETMAVLNY